MEVVKKRKTQAIEAISSRCWDELPSGALIEITQHLSNLEDLEALHLVCTRWHSVLRAHLCNSLDGRHMGCCTPQVPWLMMAEQEGIDIDERQQHACLSSTLCLRPCSSKGKAMKLFFYSLSFQTVRQMMIKLPSELLLVIEEGNFNNCCLYSSHGWLLVVWKGAPTCLYNPFCAPPHNYIPLPTSDSIVSSCIRRFALSASPCSKSYTAVIAYGYNNIAFWRPGDVEWTLAEPPRDIYTSTFAILDVTLYQGHYYVVDEMRCIFRLNLHDYHDGENFRWIYECQLPRGMNGKNLHFLWKAYFLVESYGKLFVVVRVAMYPELQLISSPNYDYLTAGFRVMEIVVSPVGRCVDAKEVKSLGNRSMFVGRNQAFMVEVPLEGVNPCDSKASYYYGCKPNCIYFTDDRNRSPAAPECDKRTDIGVYNMADGSIQRHFQGFSLHDYSPMMLGKKG